MLQWIAFTELIVCWILWSCAFVQPSRLAADRKEVAKSPSSKWGIALVTLSFALLWMYVRPVGFHKSTAALVCSMILAPPSVALVWVAAPRLGKQWRYAAALREDHVLVQTGPYRWLRHPIYASMFGMVLATGFCWTWWPLFVASILCFIAGTEIRIHAEDRLLERDSGTSSAPGVREPGLTSPLSAKKRHKYAPFRVRLDAPKLLPA